MYEAIGLEQFLNTLPIEKRVWMYDNKPKTCVEAGELADEYEQVCKQEPGVEQQPEPMTGVQSRSVPESLEPPREGSSVKERSAGRAAGRSSETGLEGVKCFGCRQFGHVKKDCPNGKSVEKVLFSAGEKQESFCQWQLDEDLRVWHQGYVEGQKVQDILLDTGCTQTMVQADLISLEKILEDAMEK